MKDKKMRLDFCIGDGLVIVLVVLLAVGMGIFFRWNLTVQKGTTAVIYKEGKKIQELSLKKNTEIRITNHYTNRVMVKDGKVGIVESDCPGKDCVHSGWIGDAGKSLVCLPNRVEIRLEGEKEVDFIVR